MSGPNLNPKLLKVRPHRLKLLVDITKVLLQNFRDQDPHVLRIRRTNMALWESPAFHFEHPPVPFCKKYQQAYPVVKSTIDKLWTI